MVRADARPRPWYAGSTASTYTSPTASPSPLRSPPWPAGRCSFVQWKPASEPSGASASSKPSGSNQLLLSRSARSVSVRAALLRMVGEGPGVDPQPGLLVLARSKSPEPQPIQRFRVRDGSARRPFHLPELAHLVIARGRCQPRGWRAGHRGPRPAARPSASRSSCSSSRRPKPCRRCPGRPRARPQSRPGGRTRRPCRRSSREQVVTTTAAQVQPCVLQSGPTPSACSARSARATTRRGRPGRAGRRRWPTGASRATGPGSLTAAVSRLRPGAAVSG